MANTTDPAILIGGLAVAISLTTFVASQFWQSRAARASEVDAMQTKISRLEGEIDRLRDALRESERARANLQRENIELMRRLARVESWQNPEGSNK